jgi:hypothetical protein
MNRRIFLAQSFRYAVAAVVSLAAGARMTIAGLLPKLDEADPVAVQFGYKHDATQVDPAKYPRKSEGQRCANCQLYTGRPGEEWGGCSVLPDNSVNAAGWCNVWTAKQP